MGELKVFDGAKFSHEFAEENGWELDIQKDVVVDCDAE